MMQKRSVALSVVCHRSLWAEEAPRICSTKKDTFFSIKSARSITWSRTLRLWSRSVSKRRKARNNQKMLLHLGSGPTLCRKHQIDAVFCGLHGRLRRNAVGYCKCRPEKSLRATYVSTYFFGDVRSPLGSVVNQPANKERRDSHKES